MADQIHIAVVGGGIGGLAFAIGLLQHKHIKVSIYEAASKFSEIGAGVGFGSNSVRAMNLISPAIGASFEKILTTNAWPSKSRSWFDFQLGMPVGDKTTGHRVVEVLLPVNNKQSTVHRAHFLDELIALIPEGVAYFGKRLTGLDQSSADHVILSFADGTTATADAVVGCDGVKSACRGLMLGVDNPLSQPRFTGRHAYRGLIQMDKAVELLGEEKARNRQMYLGHGGHVLTFPIQHGEVLNVVAFHGSKTKEWEGEWVQKTSREDLERDFEGWGEGVTNILSLLDKPDIWALFEVNPNIPCYYQDRLCLLGDGAHGTTPHLGSGAGMALEDGYILSNLLGLCSPSDPSSIAAAFKAYDAIRRPRTQKVIRESNAQGVVMDLEDPVFGEDLDAVARSLDSRVRFVWGVDLESELERAKEAFEMEKITEGGK